MPIYVRNSYTEIRNVTFISYIQLVMAIIIIMHQMAQSYSKILCDAEGFIYY